MNKTFKYIVLLALACFVGKEKEKEKKTQEYTIHKIDYHIM